jgi:hypothetical protein
MLLANRLPVVDETLTASAVGNLALEAPELARGHAKASFRDGARACKSYAYTCARVRTCAEAALTLKPKLLRADRDGGRERSMRMLTSTLTLLSLVLCTGGIAFRPVSVAFAAEATQTPIPDENAGNGVCRLAEPQAPPEPVVLDARRLGANAARVMPLNGAGYNYRQPGVESSRPRPSHSQSKP